MKRAHQARGDLIGHDGFSPMSHRSVTFPHDSRFSRFSSFGRIPEARQSRSLFFVLCLASDIAFLMRVSGMFKVVFIIPQEIFIRLPVFRIFEEALRFK